MNRIDSESVSPAHLLKPSITHGSSELVKAHTPRRGRYSCRNMQALHGSRYCIPSTRFNRLPLSQLVPRPAVPRGACGSVPDMRSRRWRSESGWAVWHGPELVKAHTPRGVRPSCCSTFLSVPPSLSPPPTPDPPIPPPPLRRHSLLPSYPSPPSILSHPTSPHPFDSLFYGGSACINAT